MDEIFGAKNFLSMIVVEKTSSATSEALSSICDYLLWYARDISRVKSRKLFRPKILGKEGTSQYVWVESPDGQIERRITKEESEHLDRIPSGWRVFACSDITSQRPAQDGDVRGYSYNGEEFTPGKGTFKTDKSGLDALAAARRLKPIGKSLMYKRYLMDFVVSRLLTFGTTQR